MTVLEWTLEKLEAVKESHRILIRDPLHLIPETDGEIHRFASEHGFTVIVAATNLVFRELYEKALAAPDTNRILLIDRAPLRRRTRPSVMKAPPPFYPDLLADTPEDARIDLDLRQFLRDTTGDPNWPYKVNDPRFARLVVRKLESVLRAHQNLRTAHPERFTDHDFKTLVAFAALGVPDTAFKKLDDEDCWKIGLLGHEALDDLESLTPEITKLIRDELRKAPSPFRWLADHDADDVIRAFYLSMILAQHTKNWSLLLANIDPGLKRYSDIVPEVLQESGPKLIELDREQAQRDLEAVERSLTKDILQLLLFDQMGLKESKGFTSVIEKESYSSLFRSSALLLALEDLLTNDGNQEDHSRIYNTLFPEVVGDKTGFLDSRPTVTWSHLKKAYWLASRIQSIKNELGISVKNLKVMKSDQLTYSFFRNLWNEKGINRIEYYLSSLERLVYSGDLLPRPEDELPSVFSNALQRLRDSVLGIADEVGRQLDDVNRRFQEMVRIRYPSWIEEDGDVILTSQFLRRCLKPNWDPKKERAVVFIFDGMRYEIWEEMLLPMLEERMEVIKDYAATSLLPSETHITRKAISAGTYTDEFNTRDGEDRLLKSGLAREFAYTGEVEVVSPEGTGTGETVRYRAGNLDVFIFELCDKELHKIRMKTLPNGRHVPARPLSFIYNQHLKNIIDTEIMAIVRGFPSGTKVFVTADHGFGRIHRNRVWLEPSWLNEPQDCNYLNARLKQRLADVGAPNKVMEKVWEFTVDELRMPASERGYDRRTKQEWEKHYATVIFPKTGYALSRPHTHFKPDAYSHGGMSIQELMIPMIVLRVKPPEEGLVTLDDITGPNEVLEGEEIEFRMPLNRNPREGAEQEGVRVDVTATYGQGPDEHHLQPQVLYVPLKGTEVVYRFRPNANDAKDEERKRGTMERVLIITVSYRDGRRTSRKSRTHRFSIRLNSEKVIRRVPPHLGNILGLMPKSMR